MGISGTLEFGEDVLRLDLPPGADLLALPADLPLADPATAIRGALRAPIGCPALPEIIRAKRSQKPDLRAVVVVSDNTRPVPYRGEQGILDPLLDILREEAVEAIELLVATGTHRPLTDEELRDLLPERVFDGTIQITNHVCTDAAMLRTVGQTSRGTDASINTHYLDADLKILTGLVEPHFMAGASGGPKSVCPGVVGEAATYTFHGPELMAHPRADSLVLDGNPCHEESLAVAEQAGVDFIVNVTLNSAKRVTGVYAGHVRDAHRQAVAHVVRTAGIPIDHEYDHVVTHAGFVGINHYQAAKAAVEAAKAVRPGGQMLLVANHTDRHPVGSTNYRHVLQHLTALGVDKFTDMLFRPDWTFIPEQWEVQMWARAFRKLEGLDHLTYCAPQLTGPLFADCNIPGRDGGADVPASAGLSDRGLAETMMQNAVTRFAQAHPNTSIAVLLDGPYGVPLVKAREAGASGSGT